MVVTISCSEFVMQIPFISGVTTVFRSLAKLIRKLPGRLIRWIGMLQSPRFIAGRVPGKTFFTTGVFP
jgi:hypothetical protein